MMKKYVSLMLILTIFLFSCSAISQTDSVSSNNDLGGLIECPVHSIAYPSYPYVFIDYVGQDAFSEWLQSQDENKSNADCIFGDGFPKFIKDFGITEEVYYNLFEGTTSYYKYDLPADIIFHGTEEEIEEYYRDIEGYQIRIVQKQCILELKEALAEKAIHKINNLRTISIKELYLASSLSEDELADIIQNINSPKHHFHISQDLIFNAKSESDIFVEVPSSTRQPNLASEDPETDFEMIVEPGVEE